MENELIKAQKLFMRQPAQKIKLSRFSCGLKQEHIDPNNDMQKYILKFSQDINNKMLFTVYQFEALTKWNNVIKNNNFSEEGLTYIHSIYITPCAFTLLNMIPSLKEEIRNSIYKISFVISTNDLIKAVTLETDIEENRINKWENRYKKIQNIDKSKIEKMMTIARKIHTTTIEKVRGDIYHSEMPIKGIWRHIPYLDENGVLQFKNVIDEDYDEEIKLVEENHPLIIELYEEWVNFCAYSTKVAAKNTQK